MSTQKDIYAASSENRPPMLNKENYVPWSSRILWYAKSRPNGKLIHNSIINGPYVRRMIPELGDPNREVPVNETFHVQTDDELTEKELKQIEADDQAIQTILLGLPEDIYDSRHVTIVHQIKDLHTADYTQLYDFLKYNLKEVDELKAERLAKTQDPLALMVTSNNPYTFPMLHQDQPSFNQNYMQQPMLNPEDITDPTTAMNMTLALMAKAFMLNYSTPTNNNQRISSNPHNKQIFQPGMNMGQDRQMQMVESNAENQFRQYAGQNVGKLNGYNAVQNVGNQVIQNAAQNPRVQNVGNHNGLTGVPGNANQNPNGNGNLVAARAEGNATGHNGNQIRCYNYRGVGYFARNCTVRPRRMDVVYLQTQLLIAQKEEAGIQLQSEEFDLMAASADLDEIEEVNTNFILMANLQQASTSDIQTDKAPVYDSDGSAEVHNYEDCCDNEIFNMFSQEEQYTELLEPIIESHQVPQNDNNVITEINALYLSSGKQIMTLNEEISDLNKPLSKEKSTVSFLLKEKKKLKSDFKIHEDELLDKQIQLEKRIKELDNILVKTGQSIQTIHMLSPKPYSFYHTEQKMTLGYQNPFYLKQAQQKQ
uniref:Uncharacterized protein n=1 Tax=Tanacetum cinerariifolium TaxID=118510 RepID=A0A699IDX5_TANCI|nr:hypothetical protein [Tanacetum cinerariifolium]